MSIAEVFAQSILRRWAGTSPHLLVLACIFLAALVPRLLCLDCYGLWNDEAISIETAQRGVAAIFTERFGWLGNQTQFYYLLLWFMTQPADPASTALFVRLPSAIAGSLLPLVVYGLGREMFGRAQGLLAALLSALSAVLLDYSHDARPYAMLAFLTALSVYTLLMAERTGSLGWWLAFAASAAANLLNAYVALTLTLPALLPYLLWLLRRLWRGRQSAPKQLLYAMLSCITILLVALPLTLDVLTMPRTPPDWGRFSLAKVPDIAVSLLTWFTRFNLPYALEIALQGALLALCVFGAYRAARSRRWQGAAICSLFLLVPPAILAVLITSNPVFERYAIFMAPFYFLLISNALIAGISDGDKRAWGRSVRLMRGAAIAISLLVVAAFLFGAVSYLGKTSHENLSYRPDFRSVARYLSQNAASRDTIVLADEPALGYNVTHFYWRNAAPCATYDARDPLLFTHKPQGAVYWIVSSLEPSVLSTLDSGATAEGAYDITRFEKVVVLKQAQADLGMVESMERLLGLLEGSSSASRLVETLRGGTYQARGRASEAAGAYVEAGVFLPLAGEYLRTAEGFERLGLQRKAWQEGLIAKSMQPAERSVHSWLARQLLEGGYAEEGQIEARIVGLLP